MYSIFINAQVFYILLFFLFLFFLLQGKKYVFFVNSDNLGVVVDLSILILSFHSFFCYFGCINGLFICESWSLMSPISLIG